MTAASPISRRQTVKRSKTLRHFLEYIALRVILGLFRILPLKLLLGLSRLTADAAFWTMRSKRRVSMHNLQASGIASTSREACRIARDSFRHFAAMVVESLKAETVITDDNWREHIAIEADEDLIATVMEPGLGVIVTTAHFGNWEIAAQALSYYKPVVALARRMNNPYTDALIQNRKTSQRFRIIKPSGSFAHQMMTPIEQGEALAMLADQHARSGGMIIDFLGRPAACHTSPARLHLATGAPLCFGYCVRTGPMQYALRGIPVIRHTPTGDRAHDMRTILETLNRGLEDAIRKNPEQYLWAHRRWRADSARRIRQT